jgi:hypothetical protein
MSAVALSGLFDCCFSWPRRLERPGPPGILYVPRYHFHVVGGVEVFDSLRQVLPDNEAARTRAVELATNLGKANLADLTTKAIRVTNDEGAVLFRVPIRRTI